ncbi:TIGR03087 family PEP-CTERM/XrtA system glycosyltransferase [Inmirania thermothiophila]|uniref:Sugar transferase (PEP-CTERM/EpsH1 system associated) n=1 Tax=Inmirania thermothiophila TaxID=1750597 RepID=A0A3N1YAT7_9GAMM|nr:TIGR03087 family PEP-CTERM/XrtA system glycosyltransferase [Inmirania thermothiophila]ROR34742.1 sugar transferase (PEP-CTERM/EpsH1 system associated) [Inmirania thermothiophila]
MSAGPDILLVTHRIPYPPDKGDKIRSWRILRHLAGRARVHLATFVDDPADRVHVPHLAGLCASLRVAEAGGWRGRRRAALGLLRGEALTLAWYRDPALAAWVRETVARHRIEAALAFSSGVAPYALVPGLRRRVLDLVDVDSDKWRQYAEGRGGAARWVYGREARRLAAAERAFVAAFDATLVVSEAEAALLGRIAPGAEGRIRVMRNGVDCGWFDPAGAGPSPYREGERAVVFTGAMDYWANVDAVLWLAREVWPAVRRRHPGARLYVVGARPAPVVAALDGRDGIVVTGRVEDVRPYLAHAAAAVAPLRIARGVQNKVLEAMAMGRAVVATPAAVRGIAGLRGDEVTVAQDAGAFAEAVARLVAGDDGGQGRRARAFVRARYGWDEALAVLDEALGLDGAPAASREATA